jgi:steroid delta-isomerase-like uncharacterized protein
MKRLGITMGAACIALSMMSCKKDDKAKGEEPVPQAKTTEPVAEPVIKEEPKELTGADYAKHVQEGWAAFNAGDMEALGSHYADDASLDLVDSGQPVSEGREAVLATIGMFRTAFPDMKAEQALFLVSGNKVVTVDLMTGTNKGELMGMPATDKPVGFLIAHQFEMNAEGKVQKEMATFDMGTMMGQLGAHKMPHRAVMTATGKNAEPVIATGDEKEAANLATIETADGLVNERKMDEFFALMTDDIAMSDQSMPADMTGLPAVKAIFEGYMKAFSDMKMKPEWSIAAGDYVVRVGTISGTNDGALPAMGLKKATGKAIKMSMLDVMQIADGKVKQNWTFTNGMAMATQLGLMEEPKK